MVNKISASDTPPGKQGMANILLRLKETSTKIESLKTTVAPTIKKSCHASIRSIIVRINYCGLTYKRKNHKHLLYKYLWFTGAGRAFQISNPIFNDFVKIKAFFDKFLG